jgi:hypothetical protein
MHKVLKLTVLLGCSVTAPLVFAGGQSGVNSQGDGSVQDAIRFERAKDSADARQARINQSRPLQVTDSQTAIAPGQVLVTDPGPEAAARFERDKDAAAARQARIEQQQNSVGNADRRMTGHN